MWLKAFAEAEGDENKATAIYARLRVESLKAEASKAINLEGGKRPKKWVESEEVTIPEETAAELYHRAHNARFLGKRKDLGAELYEELIKRFPETKEARYAKAHIKTLRTGSPTH